MNMSDVLGQEASADLHLFFSTWLSANDQEKEQLKNEAKSLNAKYSGGSMQFLDSYISRLVTSLVTLFAETPMNKLTEEDMRKELKNLEVYHLEKHR